MRIETIQIESFGRSRARTDWSGSAVLGAQRPAVREFADLVAERLVGTVLPLTQREALLRVAALRGIGRFEANLIIAAVQHQLGVGHRRKLEARPRTGLKIAAGVGVFVAVQAGIIFAAWHWLF
jgi:hypothetical protein